MSKQQLSSEAPVGVWFVVLLLILGSVGFVVAVIGRYVNWSALSNWLTSQDQALVGLGAIATGGAALIGGIGLVVAGIAAIAALRQVELQREIAEKQSSRECLWRFTDEWRDFVLKKGEDKENHWIRALKVLKSSSWKRSVEPAEFIGQADIDVVDVLNFFDGVAYMRKRGDLGQELAWTAFGSNALPFFERSRAFVDAYRLGQIKRTESDRSPNEKDMSFWEDLEWWAKELKAYDDRRTAEANARES